MANDDSSITWNLPVLALAAGIACLGVLSLLSGDFGFQWQPVSQSLPNRAQWATAVGIAEIIAAVALVLPRWRTVGAVAAASLYAFWALFHAPGIMEKPLNVAAWLGAAEPFAIACAALALAHLSGQDTPLMNAFVRAFGAACVIFGASHFAYAEFTADMVPNWLPERLFLAYATGAVHAGCGLALLIGIARPLAAIAEAAMMSSFVALVHVPRVAAAPSNRFEWTMMCAAITLAASAWIVATLLPEGFNLRRPQPAAASPHH